MSDSSTKVHLKDLKDPYYPYEERKWLPIEWEGNPIKNTITLQNYPCSCISVPITEGNLYSSSLHPEILHLRLQLNNLNGHIMRNFGLVDDLKAEFEAIQPYIADMSISAPNEIQIPFGPKQNFCEIVKTSKKKTNDVSVRILPELQGNFELDDKKERMKYCFSYPVDGNVYGLGEKYWGLDKKGRRYVFYNTDFDHAHTRKEPAYQSHPWMMLNFKNNQGKRVYLGIFNDRPEKTYFDLASKTKDKIEIEVFAPILDLFFIYGEEPFDVLNLFTTLTGRMPLPPLWSLGMHQCRWGYRTSDDIRKITAEYRARHIPCDTIWMDIDYMDSWALFTWDPKRYGDYKQLIQEVHAKDWHTVTIVDPGMALKPNYKPVIDGIFNDMFCYKTEIKEGHRGIYEAGVWPVSALFPDFFRTKVKEWWADLHEKFLQDSGIDGIWNDMNELVAFGPDRRTYPHMLHLDDSGQLFRHYDLHNVYALEEAKATFLGIKNAYPTRRPFILTRAGYLGIQRYSAIWTGDNFKIFEDLAQSIPMLANLGLSGQSFVGADIGGFSGGMVSPLLLIRWSQMGIFYPFARNHSAFMAQEPWTQEMLMPNSVDIIRTYYRFRYLILPYLYTQFYIASTTGFPIWRPLVSMFPDDSYTFQLDDEVMIGNSILIAPVYDEPEMDDAASTDELVFFPTKRSIYLPQNDSSDSWFDLMQKKFIPGGKKIDIECRLEEFPIYIRNNSVIPCRPIQQTTMNLNELPLLLYVFSDPLFSSKSTLREKPYEKSVLYVDAGDGDEFRILESYNFYEFALESDSQSIKFKILKIHENDMPLQLKQMVVIFEGLENQPKSIQVNSNNIEITQEPSNVPSLHPYAWNPISTPNELIIPKNETAVYNSEAKNVVMSIEYHKIQSNDLNILVIR